MQHLPIGGSGRPFTGRGGCFGSLGGCLVSGHALKGVPLLLIAAYFRSDPGGSCGKPLLPLCLEELYPVQQPFLMSCVHANSSRYDLSIATMWGIDDIIKNDSMFC
jgi:hypothetical protein